MMAKITNKKIDTGRPTKPRRNLDDIVISKREAPASARKAMELLLKSRYGEQWEKALAR